MSTRREPNQTAPEIYFISNGHQIQISATARPTSLPEFMVTASIESGSVEHFIRTVQCHLWPRWAALLTLAIAAIAIWSV